MSDSIELQNLKEEVKKFIDLLQTDGIIEETGQKYKKAYITAIFDEDKKLVYTLIENLKTMSK